VLGERSKIKYELEQKKKERKKENEETKLMSEELHDAGTVNIMTVDTSASKCTQ